MKDCELFAPSALIQSCDRSSANFYALYSNREGTAGLIYSSREGMAGLIYSNREGTARSVYSSRSTFSYQCSL